MIQQAKALASTPWQTQAPAESGYQANIKYAPDCPKTLLNV